MNGPLSSFEKFKVLFFCEARRDIQNPIAFASKYLWILFLCFIYGFFFKAAVWHREIRLDGYLIDFPLFLVSGFLALRTVPFSVKIFDEMLKGLKNAGLTEWARLTPTSPWELFIARTVWNFSLALTELAALVCFARILIGTPLRPFFQTSMILPMLLLFAAQAGIGMTICGVAILLKKMDFFFAFFSQISMALGGVFFPAEMLSGQFKFLSFLSDSLPLTHALHTVRLRLIHEGTEVAGKHEQVLALLALFYLLTGTIILRRALRWTKKTGV